MKRRILLLWTLLIALPLHAETSVSVSAPLAPIHKGYAFDRPRVLVQQRLFGLAHGVTLLAATCAHEPAYREAVTTVYTEWHQQQASTIEAITSDLAHYYFGDRADEASKQDIATALKLQRKLGLKSGSKTLYAACDTIAEALQKPRYNLRQQYLLQSYASRLAVATAIAAEADVCRPGLPAESQLQLDEAMTLWHKTYDAKVDKARTLLEQQWTDAQIDGTLDEWLAQARTNGKKKRHAVSEAVPEDAMPCTTMATWLQTTQADPDDEFKPNP